MIRQFIIPAIIAMLALCLFACTQAPPAVANSPVITEIPPQVAQTAELPQPLILFGQTIPPDTEAVSVPESASFEEVVQAIPLLPSLQTLDVSLCGFSNQQLLLLAQASDGLQLVCTVNLFGASVNNDAKQLAPVSALPDDAIVEALEKLSQDLALFPRLSQVDLSGLITESGADLPAASITAMQGAWPNIKFEYVFHYLGQEIPTDTTTLDLKNVRIKAEDLAGLTEILACLPQCTYADFAGTRVSNEQMQQLADTFPQIKFSWLVYVSVFRCRTDANMFKASRDIKSEMFGSKEAAVLAYCTELEYLDVGHNKLTDIAFVSAMPELKVFIGAISHYIQDISPIANCKKLEYLELFTNNISDITPLAELTNLEHLNLCNNNISDASPLYGLQKLKRLWISKNNLSQAQMDALVAHLPNCTINFTTKNPTGEGWRKDPRYDLLSEQFHYGSGLVYIRFDPYEEWK